MFLGIFERRVATLIVYPSKSRDLDAYTLKTGLKVLKLIGIEKLEHVEVTKECPWEAHLPRTVTQR